MKKFFEEFKTFISRGNVIDMAVGIIVGSAFTAIVTSLVNDIITPLIAKLIGGLNFENLKIVLTEASGDIEETAVYYGVFIQKIIDFIIVAFIIFLVVKGINAMHRKKEEAPAPAPKPDPQIELLTEIRDLMKGETSEKASSEEKTE